MSSSLRSAAAFSVLALSLAFTAGCRAPRIPQPPQVTTAGLRIDVISCVNNVRSQRIDARVRIWNDYEGKLKFDQGNVRLLYNGREVAAKASWRNPKAEVRAKSNSDWTWYFEVGETPIPGNYQIEIRDLMLEDGMLGETAAFAINLGER